MCSFDDRSPCSGAGRGRCGASNAVALRSSKRGRHRRSRRSFVRGQEHSSPVSLILRCLRDILTICSPDGHPNGDACFYRAVDIRRHPTEGLNTEQLVLFALLIGNDYDPVCTSDRFLTSLTGPADRFGWMRMPLRSRYRAVLSCPPTLRYPPGPRGYICLA